MSFFLYFFIKGCSDLIVSAGKKSYNPEIRNETMKLEKNINDVGRAFRAGFSGQYGNISEGQSQKVIPKKSGDNGGMHKGADILPNYSNFTDTTAGGVYRFSRGIDISYDQVMNHFSDYIVMEKIRSNKGQDRYLGQTADGSVVLDITGNKNNISEAALVIAVTNAASNALTSNAAGMILFIRNLFPERQTEVSKWFISAIGAVEKSSESPIENIFGNKKIQVWSLEAAGAIGIIVKHKNADNPDDGTIVIKKISVGLTNQNKASNEKKTNSK